MEPWYRAAFRRDYSSLYRHRSVEAAAAEVGWAQGVLPGGGRWLDLACGNGRHLSKILESAPGSVGLDLSTDLLREAHDRGLGGRVVGADMRQLPFRSASFLAVTSFFTSFGYFKEQSEDERVCQEIARVLRPGGAVLVDFLNADHVRATLVPEDERVHEGRVFRQHRSVSADGQRVEKRVEILETDGRTHSYVESVRLYGLSSFREMFDRAGLRLVTQFGSLRGDPLEADSTRLVLLAEKPET